MKRNASITQLMTGLVVQNIRACCSIAI